MSPSTETSETRELAAELKFLVSPEKACAIRDWIRERLDADPNGCGDQGDTYLTTSLYFDTATFDVFRREGSFKRAKYRVRRYGSAATLFLERKLKTRNLVAKRRATIDLSELPRIAADEAEERWSGFWFHRRLLARRLNPVCQVSYERTARVAATASGPIRFTLDRDIRATPLSTLGFRAGDSAVPVSDACIIELKYRRAMPAVFKQVLVEFGLVPEPLSKYRLAVNALQLAGEKMVGVHA